MVINCVSSPFGCFTSLARFCPGRRFCDNERWNTDEVRTTFTGFQSSSKILVSQKRFLMLCLTLPFLTIYFLNKMLHKNRNRMKNSPFLQEYCKGTTKRTNTKIILVKETASNFFPVFARKLEKKNGWLHKNELDLSNFCVHYSCFHVLPQFPWHLWNSCTHAQICI